MNFKIRKAEPKDTREIWEAHVASIQGICSKNYSTEQINAWSAFSYNHDWVKTIEKDYVLVIEADGRVEGFCHVVFHERSTSEIAGLYFSPKVAGKGFGKKVVSAALDYIKSSGSSRIVIKSTKTAEGFYRRMGFQNSGSEQFHEIRGVRLECLPMELEL